MAHTITAVHAGSPAQQAGVLPGDRLTRLNGAFIIDFLDYQALECEERVEVEVVREGRTLRFACVKDEYEPLGLEFTSPMMSGMRMCCNRCLFCFVDQLPAYARDSLRVKDDDWRTSLMMGSYVTLTNVPDAGLDRIIRRHASPLYISVHATDPDIRSRLLGTPRGGMLMRQLRKLSDGGIQFHCQAVLCPGLNDGDVLNRTIRELTGIEGALSLAVVPVGLTDHREGLAPLRKYTKEEARDVLEMCERWRERLLRERGTRFVFPSDEFYVEAEAEIPPDETYEGYQQIDDGVGMLRLFETEFREAWEELPPEERQPGGDTHIIYAVGVSAEAFMRDVIARYPLTGADVEVRAIGNGFFGPSVTVSGLVTGGDLLRDIEPASARGVVITSCMLRPEDQIFLDDRTLGEVRTKLRMPLVPYGRRGDECLSAIRALCGR